jgi:hypothetical protein
MMCEKIRRFVYAPKEIQDMFKADAGWLTSRPPLSYMNTLLMTLSLAAEDINLISVVLRSADEPVLTRAQMQRVGRAHRSHAEYVKIRDSLADSDDDDGPQDEDAWLYEDLKVLTHLYSRLRDREQLIALIFEVGTESWLCVSPFERTHDDRASLQNY